MSDTPRVEPSRPPEPEASTRRSRVTPLDLVRLLVELFAVFTFAFWGFAAWTFPWSIIVGVGAPVVAIVLWALFVSPKAMLAVHPFVAAVVELIIFAAATVAWWSLGQMWIGLAFALVAIASGVMAGRRRFE